MVERVSIHWPRGPDLSGLTPDYADIVLHRALPFDTEDPFIFHVLTTLGSGEELLRIMRDGGSLMPASWAEKRWGDERSMIFARDRIAGDDEYLFTTPCNVFSQHHERATRNPAVAFRLSYVASVAKKLAFRVHDLEPLYKEAEEMASDPEFYDDEDYDFDEGMDDQDERYEEAIASAVEEQLRGIADFGTQYDKDDALELTHLYAEVVGGFRRGTRWVPADDPERLRIVEAAKDLFPECIQDLDECMDWAQEIGVERQLGSLVNSWWDLFGVDLEKPMPTTQLFAAPASERPELLVQGALVLCEAAFYRDEHGAWRPVPSEVCLAGRAA